MQIMPSNRADSTFGLFSGSDSASGSGFFDAMQDAMSSVEDGYNFSATSALAEGNQPLVESPYSRQTTDGVTYTLEEVTFTKSELEELRKQLIKEGAPEEALRQFDILADQPDGATLAQVLASLMGGKAPKFSDEDAQAITALLGQIDPSGTLAGDAIAFMRQGSGQAALGLIQDALAKMPADQRVDIDPDAMLALGRGLGLSSDTMQSIIGSMRGMSLSLNGGQFTALLEPAKNQFTLDAANQQKLDAALEKTLKPIIAKARDRMEKEKAAAELESRRVQQSRILIDRTVQKNSRETMEETLAGEAAAESGKAGGMIGHAGDARAEAAQAGAQKVGNGKSAQTGKIIDGNEQGLVENAKFAANAHELPKEMAGGDADAKGKGKDSAWQDLLGKVEVKAAAANPTLNSNSVVYSMLQGNLENQVLDMEERLNAQNLNQLNQQLARQVEQGVLTAMRDGASRLDLQLHPAELGSLAITLIARNGEVTAQIRSERTETAEMLQRQMETLRVNLEQQGLKVDKIEVMLDNRQDDFQNQLADLGGHNARQEEEAMRQQLARMKNLASLRQESVAQQLHNSGQAARYAGNALHVVA